GFGTLKHISQGSHLAGQTHSKEIRILMSDQGIIKMNATNKIELPAEFQSGNSVPVTLATIKRERMQEILHETVEAHLKTITDALEARYEQAFAAYNKTKDSYHEGYSDA